jgi:hypothetical protein
MTGTLTVAKECPFMGKLDTISQTMRERARKQPNRMLKHRIRRDMALAMFYRDSHFHLTVSRKHKPPTRGQVAMIKRAFGIPAPLSWTSCRQGCHHLWRISWHNNGTVN